MYKVLFKFEDGSTVESFATEGENLLEVARKSNVAIDAPCSAQYIRRMGKCIISNMAIRI